MLCSSQGTSESVSWVLLYPVAAQLSSLHSYFPIILLFSFCLPTFLLGYLTVEFCSDRYRQFELVIKTSFNTQRTVPSAKYRHSRQRQAFVNQLPRRSTAYRLPFTTTVHFPHLRMRRRC